MNWHDTTIPKKDRIKEIINYYISQGKTKEEAKRIADNIIFSDDASMRQVRMMLVDKYIDDYKIIEPNIEVALEKIENYIGFGLFETNKYVEDFKAYMKKETNNISEPTTTRSPLIIYPNKRTKRST